MMMESLPRIIALQSINKMKSETIIAGLKRTVEMVVPIISL